MIGEAVLRFFEHNFDAPLVVQLLCIAFSAVLLLGVPAGTKIKPLRFAVETVCLAAVFLLLNIVFSVTAALVRLTFGSYWNYLLGIALYAAVRSRLMRGRTKLREYLEKGGWAYADQNY